jgi:hypothetical protein
MSDPINTASLEWMPKQVWGPIKWKELHTRALIPLSPDELKDWFGGFMASLPCEECRTHFNQWVLDNPPDFTKFFAWTVAAHNEVNEKTGKPSVSEEEARIIHGVG